MCHINNLSYFDMGMHILASAQQNHCTAVVVGMQISLMTFFASLFGNGGRF